MAEFEPDEIESVEDEDEIESPRRSFHEVYGAWPTWTQNLAKVVAGLIVLVILILIGRSIHHAVKDHNTANSGNSGSHQTASTPPKQSGTSKSGSTAGSSSSGSSSQSTSGQSAQSATQVPNTGPGDVAAIFVGSTLVAAGAHYFVRPRRSKL